MSDVIIPAVYETHVYESEDGDVVIRQVNPGEDDDVIIVPAMFAKAVAEAILRAAGAE